MRADVSCIEGGAGRDIRVRDRAGFHAERRDALGCNRRKRSLQVKARTNLHMIPRAVYRCCPPLTPSTSSHPLAPLTPFTSSHPFRSPSTLSALLVAPGQASRSDHKRLNNQLTEMNPADRAGLRSCIRASSSFRRIGGSRTKGKDYLNVPVSPRPIKLFHRGTRQHWGTQCILLPGTGALS